MIHKVNTSWVRAVMGRSIEDTFQDAWNTILNAIEGSWGDITFKILDDVETKASIIKSNYKASVDVSNVSGLTTITIPYVSVGPAFILVETVNGTGLITNSSKYVIEQGVTSKDVNIPSGRNIITVTGTARRI